MEVCKGLKENTCRYIIYMVINNYVVHILFTEFCWWCVLKSTYTKNINGYKKIIRPPPQVMSPPHGATSLHELSVSDMPPMLLPSHCESHK